MNFTKFSEHDKNEKQKYEYGKRYISKDTPGMYISIATFW